MLKIVRHSQVPHWTSTTPRPRRMTLYATGQVLSRVSACLERGRDCELPILTLLTLISSCIYIIIVIALTGRQYSFELSGPGFDYSLSSTLQGSHLWESNDRRPIYAVSKARWCGADGGWGWSCPVVGNLSPKLLPANFNRLHKSLITPYLQ